MAIIGSLAGVAWSRCLLLHVPGVLELVFQPAGEWVRVLEGPGASAAHWCVRLVLVLVLAHWCVVWDLGPLVDRAVSWGGYGLR